MSRVRAKSRKQYVLQNDAALIAGKLPGVRGAKRLAFIEPSLATLRDKVPSGAKWVHEIKFDGYRLQFHKNQNNIRAYTRRGYDWTKRFDSLVNALWRLQVHDVVIDGEVIVPTRPATPILARSKATSARAAPIASSITPSTCCTFTATTCDGALSSIASIGR